MKRRSAEILQKLTQKRNRDLSLEYFTKEYNVSPRTIRNDIKEINDFLNSIPISNIEIEDNGKLTFDESFDGVLVQQYLYNMDLYEYKLSSRERQIYILISLFMSRNYISMQQMAKELYVSRITIISDIDDIKDYLTEFDVELILDSGKGMMLQCSYEQKINILISLYKEIVIENKSFFQKLILEKMKIKYTFSDIFVYIQEYSKINNIVFVENVFYEIVLFIFIIFNTPQDREEYNDNDTDINDFEDIDNIILYEGKKLNINVTDNMIKQFRTYMKKKHLNSFIKSIDEIELYKVIIHFISEIEKEYNVNLSGDNVLLDSLFMHIKGMKDWGNYEIEIPKKEKYSIDYDFLETLVEKYSYILESFLGYKLNINMKRSIVIHICVALIRNRKYTERLSVIIVCPGSMATGKYLEAQIENYFDFDILGVYTVNDILNILNETKVKVDFIISTVRIKIDEYKVITVNPFLTMEDLNLIQKETFQKHNINTIDIDEKENKILNYVSSLIKEKELEKELLENIQTIFYTYKKSMKFNNKSPLCELLTEDFVIKTTEELEWRDAIRLSALPLEKRGYITSEYTKQSIENVETYGAYIVVSPNVALAHAEKKYGVIKDGLSVLVSKKSILFPDEQEVHLLFCFSSLGEKEYLDMLKSIISIGKDKDKLLNIINKNEIKDIYKAIIQ